MGSSEPNGWPRAAVYNTIGISIFTAFLIVLLAWSSSRSGGIVTNLIFFHGDCEEANRTNLWLHLLLNVFSTAVLASSNFFMQSLSAPTRTEVNAAHRRGISLDIGVQSFHNLRYISTLKSVSWVVLFVSSLPLHLVFNSAIFATQYSGGRWNLTIASEGFRDGAQHFPPGAILVPSGIDAEYGQGFNATTYFDPASQIARAIASASKDALSWKRIEVPECLSQYMYCSPRQTYGDVVLVVRSHSRNYMVERNESLGWTRNNLFGDLTASEELFWDSHVPADESNSLWFASLCDTIVNLDPRAHRSLGCEQSCRGAFGRGEFLLDVVSPDEIPADYTFDFLSRLYNMGNIPQLVRPEVATLDLEYCLAQEINPRCKVGLSNVLLSTVLICTLIKTLVCVIIVIRPILKESLVVPGDAVVSFITDPDEMTVGWCTLDRLRPKDAVEIALRSATVPEPTVWHERRKKWHSTVSRKAWILSYAIFAITILLVGILFGSANTTNAIGTSGQGFGPSITNGILQTEGQGPSRLPSAMISANMPQLLLSAYYLVYNSFYTRHWVEKEWGSYSLAHRPLRVTRPKGDQRSTYRLQLPYRYSIPLMAISALLHWLVSNTLYVFIMEGGYYRLGEMLYGGFRGRQESAPETGLSDDAYIGIGYSTTATMIVLAVAFALAIVPFIVLIRPSQNPMPLCGGSSLVISAACHSFPVRDTPQPTNNETDEGYNAVPEADPDQLAYRNNEQPTTEASSSMSQERIEPCTHSDTEGMLRLEELGDGSNRERREGLLRVSQSPIRWGVVRSSGEAQAESSTVGHLGFGTKETWVSKPTEGNLYY